jgi:hypothetical protein
MSWLARLREKNLDIGGSEPTKLPKGAFVNSVSASGVVSEFFSDQVEDLREHFEERAAIREYCGNEPREKAEAEAWAALRVYEYRLTDNGSCGPWLILLAPGCDLLEVERSLENRLGAERVQDVRERHHD